MGHFLLTSPLLPILFLIGFILLTVCNTALIHLGRFKSKELLRVSQPSMFFFHRLLNRISLKHDFENFYFSISSSKTIYLLAFSISAVFYALSFSFLKNNFYELSASRSFFPFFVSGAFIVAIAVVLDFLARLFASSWSRSLLNISAPFAFLYLIVLFPVTWTFLQIKKFFLLRFPEQEKTAFADKTKLSEMIRESDLKYHLEMSDQKLISSFINFKERVAKEIMVPRVDLFALSSDTSIREAAQLFAKEGYSRIPIYKDTLDQIVGVVLYKDLLKCYAALDQNLDLFLETIAKPVLYSPENKKVSQLLQEFRSKQIHMAIVVDEYGGTEGIVTIEDILEELVGEIEDEYDIGEEHPFWQIPGGGWIIDAKMTLLDIADQIGIRIPTHPEYETLGGYVYHCAGTIPTKGWRLSHDEFDLEVISSNERAIKKIKIQPRLTQ